MSVHKPTRLNVGCGRNIIEGWLNLDMMPLPGINIVADLENCATKPLPIDSDSVDEFLLSHVIEHIRHPLPLMQELWRVAKPEARMTIRVPHGGSDDAWEDPTHVRAYFTNSFGYYSQPYYWRADYGYRGDWRHEKLTFIVNPQGNSHLSPAEVMLKINTQRNVVVEMIAELVCIKPAREPKRELQQSPQIYIQLA
jgi:SAM-dependent methyltransferase